MARSAEDLLDFVMTVHPMYARYEDDWKLAVRSYYGGVEYRDANYLKAYDIDYTTPSEVISTYDTDDQGRTTNKYKSSVAYTNTRSEAENGTSYASNFYQEKIQNVPVFPYTRLYVSEYNSILFRNPPTRELPESPQIESFVTDVSGDGLSLNEFMSQVDLFSTVYGVVWISCVKSSEAEYALWKMHSPLDVTNWKFSYDKDGKLTLKELLIRTADEDDVTIYTYYTPEEIHTIFVPKDEETEVEIDADDLIEEEEYSRIIQANPLGYIPVVPVYAQNKIHNGVGSTPIFDIAQIQRSIYSDMGEIYSSISYGAHGVVVVDETTAELNDNAISGEPGSVIRTASPIAGGGPNYVFEFKAPPLDSIKELRELIDQKIEKMNAVAMIRSDELIRASRSGVQIETFDDKLTAFIRKKAQNLENVEAHQLWPMWFDWNNQTLPEELEISYNRQYNRRGVEQEIAEIKHLLDAYERFEQVFYTRPSNLLPTTTPFIAEHFATQAEAEARAVELGSSGFHTHEVNGETVYIPFNTHEEYELVLELNNPGVDYEESNSIAGGSVKEELRERIQSRLEELLGNTGTINSL